MYKGMWILQLKEIEDSGGFGVQKLFEDDYEGSCPCFSGKFRVDDQDCEVWGRCWRVSDKGQDLHIFAPKEIGEAIKRCLDKQEWYQEYTIIKHNKTFL